MVEITVFRVNSQENQLQLVLNTGIGETIQSVHIWNQNTFKDYSQVKDFTSKLSQTSNNEVINISATELEDDLSGIYFVEVTDSTTGAECVGCTNTSLGVAVDLVRFQYCLSEYLCKVDLDCASCNQALNHALTLKLYIDGVKNSLQLGNFTTAITFWKNLDRTCSKSCKECANLSYIARKGLGFQTLNNELTLY